MNKTKLLNEIKRHEDKANALFDWLINHKPEHPNWNMNCSDRNYHLSEIYLIEEKINMIEHPGNKRSFPETLSVPKKCKNVN